VNTQRISITLPSHIASRVRKYSKQMKRPVSGIIAEALEEQEQRRIDRLMIEGYREFAALNRQLAEEALPAIREVLPTD